MTKVNLKKEDVMLHNILYAITSSQDYEMERLILLEPLCDDIIDKKNYNLDKKDKFDYIICEGGHCSCYNFDETEWEFIGYTKEELTKLARARLNDEWTKLYEKCFYNFVLKVVI